MITSYFHILLLYETQDQDSLKESPDYYAHIIQVCFLVLIKYRKNIVKKQQMKKGAAMDLLF